MELYFKGDQNSALAVRHVSHILESKGQPIMDIAIDDINDIDESLKKVENTLGDEYPTLASNIESIKHTAEAAMGETIDIAKRIRELSIEGVAPSQDVIYQNLQKEGSAFVEYMSNIQRVMMSNFYEMNEIVEASRVRSKKTILEKVNDLRDSIVSYLQSLRYLSFVELYNQSKSHRNNKLEELENSTALSNWISLLKLSPTLNQYLKAKQEFLIKLINVHYEAKIEHNLRPQPYELAAVKESFIKDAMHKLFEEYYEDLSAQIRQNIMANEDREVAIQRLQAIIQNALQRKVDDLLEFFDEVINNEILQGN